MDVSFERTGGFAGIRLKANFTSERLAPGDAAELRKLITAADFFNLPAEFPAAAPKPDQYLYVVTVTMEGKSHTVKTTEEAAPPALKYLLHWLNQAARRKPAQK